MLVLVREVGESVVIGKDIKITLLEVANRKKVRLGIEAPMEVPVHRLEVARAIEAGRAVNPGGGITG